MGIEEQFRAMSLLIDQLADDGQIEWASALGDQLDELYRKVCIEAREA
jgi:hypothetical protein